MNDVKLTLNVRAPSANSDALSKAATKKQAATETMDEAWARILAMKNADSDVQRLRAVKSAMDAGKLGRDSPGKRFSKAECLRLWRILAESRRGDILAEMIAGTPANYVLVDSTQKLDAMVKDIATAEYTALDCETYSVEPGGALDPWEGDIAGFSVSTASFHYYVPLKHVKQTAPNLIDAKAIIQAIVTALMTTKIIMHNAPFDCKWFAVKYGIDLVPALFADTRIMAMALDENRSHRLKDLLTDWLKLPADNYGELFPKVHRFNEVPLDAALAYAAGDTEKTLQLFHWMLAMIDQMGLTDIKRLLFDIEMPVCREFIYADLRGIRFDVEGAKVLDARFEQEEAELKRKIDAMVGEEINLNSPIQLSRKLFQEMKLPDLGNGSTGNKFLKRIEHEHEVITLILSYKEVGKLRSSFSHKLPNNVKQDGRIHPWHNTYGAHTGRFTCKDPNTQQIPARRPEIRHLFQALSDDRILVAMDYSQIELRVLAHMAKDEVLIAAFHNGQDIHSTTAALISKGAFTYEQIQSRKDVAGSKEEHFRKQAKTVNFGIVYGMTDRALSDNLRITRKEAKALIEDYFRGYPGIKRYMDEQHALVKKQGFITDLYGRKRRLHSEMKSREFWKVASAERMAGNFPIQSSAGSMLKAAIVDLNPVLAKHDSNILLQVHDELVFDCPKDITPEALSEIQQTMENVRDIGVPVRCDIDIYPERWAQK